MQVIWLKLFAFDSSSTCLPVMAPMKSAMKAKKVAMKATKAQKVMTKGALLGELANATEMKKADISKVLNTLTEIGTQEVKKSGKFILPGLCMIKTRTKAAVKGGGTRMMSQGSARESWNTACFAARDYEHRVIHAAAAVHVHYRQFLQQWVRDLSF